MLIRVQNKKRLQQEAIGGRNNEPITMLGLHESEVRYIVSRVLKGLEQLHQLNLPHGALRAGNIGINRKSGKVQLLDWGLDSLRKCFNACPTQPGELYRWKYCRWSAPEQNYAPFAQCGGTKKGDIWGLGCTVIEVRIILL